MIKVYGPYRRKDGRAHVIHYDTESQSRRTQSYPRYLMEQHLGRVLESWEHVDHINNDPTDDRVENYQLLTQKENNVKSVEPAHYITKECAYCNAEFRLPERRYYHNQIVQGKEGPYCSRSCAGKAHH